MKINEKFKGEFTNADRVLLTALHDRLLADPKLAKLARSSDPQIFTESIFPKAFDTAAQDSYLEAQDTFSSLFEDTSKYKAIMSALAEWLYGEFRKKLNSFPFYLLKQPASTGCSSRFGCSQQVFCRAKRADVYTSALLATMVLVLRSSQPVSYTDAKPKLQ